MTCRLCSDKGVFRIGYLSEPDGFMDLAICRCPRGMSMRLRGIDQLKQLLSARFNVSVDHVGLAEEFLDAEDFPAGVAQSVPENVTAVDVTDAGRSSRKARL